MGGTSPEGSGDGRRQEAGSQPLKQETVDMKLFYAKNMHCGII